MASAQRPPGFQEFDQRVLDELVDSSSESDDSYAGSDESVVRPSICSWRTPEFHDQECSRYFDCPTHLVERRLSVDDSDEHEQEHEHTHNRDDESDRHDNAPQSPVEEERPDIYSSSPPQRPASDDGDPALPTTSGLPNTSISSETASRAIESNNPDIDEAGSSSHDREASTPAQQQAISSDGSDPRIASGDVDNHNETSRSDRPRFRYLPVSRDIMDDPLGSPSGDLAEHGLPPLPRLPQEEGVRRPSDVQLPRWQPDAEVTYCPICHTQFSFFVRKHHCRKCGRVVCNSCSPHRIIIPHQYIVRPPGTEVAMSPSLLVDGLGTGYFDVNRMSGGERVRLCNPCVPDPNTAPPQSPSSPAASSSSRATHQRSRSSFGDAYGAVPASNRHGAVFAAGPANEYRYLTSRTRSITMGHAAGGSSHGSSSRRRRVGAPQTAAELSLAALGSGAPSSSYPSRHSSISNVASSSRQRPLPPAPQIAEEDECPICHRELPSRSLANFEELREAHITSCITSHSTYGTPRGGEGDELPPPPRRTGMYTYPATEKDCIDEAECTICLEEFTVGVPMARLECLCRFHRACISAWFVNHPGRCPVHQHDGFGY